LYESVALLRSLAVEAGQTHPDTNVGKYWLLSEHHVYSSVVLFHIYTPRYNSYGWRKTLGEFYARKMNAELPFEYSLLDFRNAEDYGATLADVQTDPAQNLDEPNFPSAPAPLFSRNVRRGPLTRRPPPRRTAQSEVRTHPYRVFVGSTPMARYRSR